MRLGPGPQWGQVSGREAYKQHIAYDRKRYTMTGSARPNQGAQVAGVVRQRYDGW